jgi:hypothetical protein
MSIHHYQWMRIDDLPYFNSLILILLNDTASP